MKPFANCSITQNLYVCCSAPQHGTPSDPDHIKFSSCVGHYSCYHNIDCCDCPCTKVPLSSTDTVTTEHFTYLQNKKSKGVI